MNSVASDKKLKRSSIRTRLIGVVLIGVATATIIGTVASAWRETVRFSEAKRAEVNGTANVFAFAVADAVAANDRVGVLKALRAIGRIPSFEYARVADSDGRTIAELGTSVSLLESDDTPFFSRSTVETEVPVVLFGRKIGTVSVLVNTRELRQRLIDSLLTGLMAALLAAAVGVAVSFRLQERIIRPLRDLTSTMAKVRRTNDFTGRVDYSADDETGVLVDTFNDMMGEIRQRDDRLARHRETLEFEIDERTRDLKAAKETAEEASAAKSDFLATMSHEIRTPMNGMLVMAELLASANLSDRHRRYADVVVKSGQSLLTIINDILDFSKIESGKLELERIDLDPAGVVDDVLNLFWDKAAEKGLDLAGYIAPDVPRSVAGDPVRLNQILSNLVNNALKFTETGYVKVSVERREDAGALRFTVADTGIGIPEDKLAAVFESFSQADQTTTRRFGGTGLGLAICKRLVTAMDGEISVSSIEGEGSAFSFTIGAAAASPTQLAAPEAVSRLRQGIVSVDGTATAEVAAAYLGERGIEVVSIAPDVLDATRVARADVVLAEPQAIRDLQANGARDDDAPYMICVSQLGDSLSDTLVRTGQADDVLMRPVSRKAIQDLIDRLEKGAPRGLTLLSPREATRIPAFPGAKVLVADDSPINREVVAEALKQMNVSPDIVTDGVAAVEAAAAKTYDLIFMDCSMPEMDGLEATRRIRKRENLSDGHVPIVALTAHVAGSSADDWRVAGMDDYMTKPFRLGDLVARFERFLPEAKQSDMPAAAPGVGDSVEIQDDPAVAADAGPIPGGLESQVDKAANEFDDLPVIDDDVLASVAACQDGDGHELLLRVFGLFEDHAPTALMRLAEKSREGSNLDIANAAHALKSMCGNIGAARLCRACEDLEASARDGATTDIAAKTARLHVNLVAALDRIRELKKDLQKESAAA